MAAFFNYFVKTLDVKKIIPIALAGLFSLFSCAAYEGTSTRTRTAQEIEMEEFNMLMKKDSLDKQNNAAESLDILLNGSPNDSRISLIVNNNTNCNIILRLSGSKIYNLPIIKNRKNFIVVEKGTYSLGANLCNSRYSTSKTFDDSATMTLSEGSK